MLSTGFENFVQFGAFAGQVTCPVKPAGGTNAAIRFCVCVVVSSPAGCCVDVSMKLVQVDSALVVLLVHPGGATFDCAAAGVLKSTPADAVASFAITVLLMKLTRTASCSDTPPPDQPATLSAMMLLITRTWYQLFGLPRLRCTSVPLTFCSRSPPPFPLSAVLPMIRLPSITRFGPMPSDSCGAQSTSTVEFSQNVPSGGTPCAMIPPPYVGNVGLLLWLNSTTLCDRSPL
ncbi:hypothetical protein BCO37747_06909 [Burkholderia contaminans]|nr:hypothetical protein BCO23253_06543 [Burkholderia contaminans]VWD57831.1 hypothetical protein BCO37747_06909 [Burkholderia contaminans]